VIQCISVNRAGNVPLQATDHLAGATIIYTGTSIFYIDNSCNIYWQGTTLNLGGSGTLISLNLAGYRSRYFRNCAFIFSTSDTAASIEYLS
jgi:hypothetical protein